jgi:hypothetical protein
MNVLRLKWSPVDLEWQHAWVDADSSKNREPISAP